MTVKNLPQWTKPWSFGQSETHCVNIAAHISHCFSSKLGTRSGWGHLCLSWSVEVPCLQSEQTGQVSLEIVHGIWGGFRLLLGIWGLNGARKKSWPCQQCGWVAKCCFTSTKTPQHQWWLHAQIWSLSCHEQHTSHTCVRDCHATYALIWLAWPGVSLVHRQFLLQPSSCTCSTEMGHGILWDYS